ncbi:DUF4838 domain-containing protein [Parapedobacter sp. DT-150]|uniref:DUF4838 domain-containing protein n=1 Tax=Parapedobacter sp. DT-150 TaxID=3396162 RepID=UPI003F1E3D8B
MKKLIILLVLTGALIPALAHDMPQKKPSSYRIMLNADVSDSEKWAAKELQQSFYKISGEYVTIQTADSKEKYDGNKVVLGYNDAVKAATGNPAPDDDDESFHYFNKGKDIFIYGGKQRGTMYGVFSFLENEFGCRWYSPLVTVIPRKEKLVFGTYDYKSSPAIQVRNVLYFEALDPLWAARNKMNGRMDAYHNEHVPGGVETYWGGHNFFLLVPPEEFYDQHPEYYSLIDGKRVHDRAQLCLSNRDVLKIATERLKKQIRQQPNHMIYDVSQMDWDNPCQCDKCQAIVKKEGAESGIVIWFVNQVAEAIEKEFPDKYVGTFAYRYTKNPPLHIKPRKNVVVRLCSDNVCRAHDLQSCEHNKAFLGFISKWAAISPQLYIWDYVVNFSHYAMPFPNIATLQPNIKTYQENKAIGIMEQGDHNGRGGEFAELKTYLLAKLLWNPDIDTEEVIEDFMDGFYGRAGKYIKQYFDLTQALVTPEVRMGMYFNADHPMYTDEFINTSLQLFDDAAKVADDDAIVARVKLCSLPVLYLKCMRHPVMSRNDGTYAEVLRIIEKEGVVFLAERYQTVEQFTKFMEEAE